MKASAVSEMVQDGRKLLHACDASHGKTPLHPKISMHNLCTLQIPWVHGAISLVLRRRQERPHSKLETLDETDPGCRSNVTHSRLGLDQRPVIFFSALQNMNLDYLICLRLLSCWVSHVTVAFAFVLVHRVAH